MDAPHGSLSGTRSVPLATLDVGQLASLQEQLEEQITCLTESIKVSILRRAFFLRHYTWLSKLCIQYELVNPVWSAIHFLFRCVLAVWILLTRVQVLKLDVWESGFSICLPLDGISDSRIWMLKNQTSCPQISKQMSNRTQELCSDVTLLQITGIYLARPKINW